MDREQREQLIDLLRGLGAADADLALDNARKAAALVEAAGLDWQDLIAFPRQDGDNFASEFDHGDIDLDDEDGESAAPSLDTADASIARTLDRLLGLEGLSVETRGDLEGFSADLAADSLDEQDRRYVLALATRLGVR